MARVALEVEYDGTGFFGWQTQAARRTVQAELEAALGRVADEPVIAHAAGRTDTGVHAAGQVVHFDTQSARSQRQWILGLNSLLPDDLAVRSAVSVPPALRRAPQRARPLLPLPDPTRHGPQSVAAQPELVDRRRARCRVDAGRCCGLHRGA